MEKPTMPLSSTDQKPCVYPINAEAMILKWMEHIAIPSTLSSIENNDHTKTSTTALATSQCDNSCKTKRPLENYTIANIASPLDIYSLENAHITRSLNNDSLVSVNSTSSLDSATIAHASIDSSADTHTTSPLDTATIRASDFTTHPPLGLSSLVSSSLDRENDAINDHIMNSIIATNDEPTIYDTTTPLLLVDSLSKAKTTKESSRSKVWRSLTTMFIPTRHKENVSIVECIRRKTASEEKQLLDLSLGTSPKGKPTLPPLRKQDKRKKTLVLDLDETLIHSSFTPLSEYDFLVQVQCENFAKGELIDVYVVTRPGLEEFLQKMSFKYEMVIFTASTKPYADAIIDQIDPTKLVKHRLYRESCIFYDGALTKDLATLGRDLHKVIIVDNTPHCYILQPNNAVPISSFIDNQEDSELIHLVPFLSLVAELDDVTISLNAIPIDFLKSDPFQRLQL